MLPTPLHGPGHVQPLSLKQWRLHFLELKYQRVEILQKTTGGVCDVIDLCML